MKFGLFLLNSHRCVRPDDLAAALEERGLDGLWLSEHTQMPTSRTTPYPMGGEMPEEYRGIRDPLVSLAAAAARTERLRLGTAVCLPLQHDTLALAKQVATLDALSGGRVDFGIGVGWNIEEYANHTDVPPRQRHRSIREHVLALRSAWVDEVSEFRGEYVDFEPTWCYPKPEQSPHPPIWFAGTGDVALRHLVEWADGWLPMDVALPDLRAGVAWMRQLAEDSGRDPRSIRITMLCMTQPDRGDFELWSELEIEQVVFTSDKPMGPRIDETLRPLDGVSELVEEFSSR